MISWKNYSQYNYKILKNLIDDKFVTYHEKKDINWDETD